MTINIRQPETEALILQRLEDGGFQDAEEAVLHALRSSPSPKVYAVELRQRSLAELSESVRGLLTDEEVDTLFRRDQSTDRPVDLV